MSNLKLWNAVEKTDPAFTKKFNRGGGFSGTATNATYLHKRATETFGPMGIGWGVNVIDERYEKGVNDDIVHVVRIKLWYLLDGQRGEIEAYGQTMFTGKNKNGAYTDEEAPKKSLTDATSKALSHLGFAADIHLGLYDDNKYVNDLKREMAEEKRQAANDEPPKEQEKKAASYDEQIAIEKELVELLDKANTPKKVTDIMLHPDTKADLARLPSDRVDAMRDYAKKRLTELGWKKDEGKEAS
jgi:hypothetical protein